MHTRIWWESIVQLRGERNYREVSSGGLKRGDGGMHTPPLA